MDRTIGIDAGGTLIKITFKENGRVHKRKYQLNHLENAMEWLKMFLATRKVVLTGGRAGKLKREFFPEAEIVDEFTATCVGAKYLMEAEGITTAEKFLLINIGTGTSWFMVNGNLYERILGSGLGGGTLLGLGSLLTGISDFSQLVHFASEGDRERVDLLVKNLYFPEIPPIPGELTASNFACAIPAEKSSAEDRMSAVSNMIAETISIITSQAAALHGVKRCVYIGSSIAGNRPLQSKLGLYAEMMGLVPIFLTDGEFSGAVGAGMF